MTALRDFSITVTVQTGNKYMLLHRTDCPQVQEWRERDMPICTMYDCKGVPDIERCTCLEDVEL